MKYRLTISNPDDNILLWQEEGYKGDITIEIEQHQLDYVLEILTKRNKCDVLVRAIDTEE